MARFQDSIETVISARDESAAELRRAETARRELVERERGRSREQENAARDLARVNAGIRQASLRAEGRDLEARLDVVRRNYAQQIQTAREAGNQELAARLRTLAQIKQAEITSRAATPAGPTGAGSGDPAAARAAAERVRRARETSQIETTIREAGLRRQGQALQADVLRIRAAFAERIRQARAADNAELASRLRTLSAIRQAEARDADTRRREEERQGRTLNRAARFGEATGVVGAIAAAAELGTGAIQAVTAAVRGDIEGVRESLDRIPVFGSIFRFGQSIQETFTGAGAEIARINELEVERTAEIRRRQTLIDANRTFEARVDTLRDQAALITAGSDAEREALTTAREREQVEQELLRLAAARGGIGRADAEQEVASLLDAIDAQRRAERQQEEDARLGGLRDARLAVENEIADARLRNAGRTLDADLAANQQAFAERIRQARAADNAELASRLRTLSAIRAQRLRDDDTEQQAQRLRAVADTEAEVTDLQLRRQGLVLDAELAANRRTFDERIRLAQAADDAQLASTLARLRDEKAADLRNNAARQDQIDGLQENIARLREQRVTPDDVTLDTNDRFLTGVREQTAAQDRAMLDGVDRQIQAAEKQVELLENLTGTQAQIAAVLAGATPVIVGGAF